MDVCSFIKAVLAQDENTIRSFFHKDAYVNWHCSNEHFTVDEFIIANCDPFTIAASLFSPKRAALPAAMTTHPIFNVLSIY